MSEIYYSTIYRLSNNLPTNHCWIPAADQDMKVQQGFPHLVLISKRFDSAFSQYSFNQVHGNDFQGGDEY